MALFFFTKNLRKLRNQFNQGAIREPIRMFQHAQPEAWTQKDRCQILIEGQQDLRFDPFRSQQQRKIQQIAPPGHALPRAAQRKLLGLLLVDRKQLESKKNMC